MCIIRSVSFLFIHSFYFFICVILHPHPSCLLNVLTKNQSSPGFLTWRLTQHVKYLFKNIILPGHFFQLWRITEYSCKTLTESEKTMIFFNKHFLLTITVGCRRGKSCMWWRYFRHTKMSLVHSWKERLQLCSCPQTIFTDFTHYIWDGFHNCEIRKFV